MEEVEAVRLMVALVEPPILALAAAMVVVTLLIQLLQVHQIPVEVEVEQNEQETGMVAQVARAL
jgi:cell division protein FtsN